MRILFLTHRLPYAANRGDRTRAHHILRVLRDLGHEVDLISLVHSVDEASHQQDLAGLVESVAVCPTPTVWNRVKGLFLLASSRCLTHVFLDSPHMAAAIETAIARNQPDVVLAYCSGMARFALAPPLAAYPLVVDLVDVDSAKWHDLAIKGRPPMSWIHHRETRLLSRFEAELAYKASATTVVTEREAAVLKTLAPSANIVISPVAVDQTGLTPSGPPGEGQDVVFCGVMDYPPNEQASVWMAHRVWPLVRARHPSARLRIVGAQPSHQVRVLANDHMGIDVTGTVPDVRPYLWNAAVSVAPLRTARGTQTKVLEAVAAGVPCVVTNVVAEGLPNAVLPACAVADTETAFADAVVRLLSLTGSERRATAERASLAELSWSAGLKPLADALTRAAATGRRTHVQES